MVKPGPMPPGEHNKVDYKKLHKLHGFPNYAPQGAVGKAFSWGGVLLGRQKLHVATNDICIACHFSNLPPESTS